MAKFTKLAGASILAMAVAAPAFAQNIAVSNRALDDQIDDQFTDVDRDFEDSQDEARFGPNDVRQGWSGSFAAGLDATSGNSDTIDVNVGGRLYYGSGPWNHTFGVLANYGEGNGDTNEQKAVASYEANRYFNDRFYMFGLGRYNYDALDEVHHQAFLGFGPGYRVIAEDNVTWRLQAGPGVTYTEYKTRSSDTDFGAVAASRFYYRINDNAFMSMDTDIVYSETNTNIYNDLGITLKVSDRLSTRFSYLTDYNTDPEGGDASTDNTFGVSLVYGF